MRLLLAFFSSLLLIAWSSVDSAAYGQSQQQGAAPTGPAEFLLTSAASDFRAHRPPYPARFREVRLGYATSSEGTRMYMLCGAFLPASESGSPQWTPFATIQTSGYEQYLGWQAAAFCDRPSIVWLEGEFSSSLQARLDALK